MDAEVRFKRLPGYAEVALPSYATAGAAGFDLRAALPADAPVTIQPGARALIDSGFAVAVPDGFEMQIRPRSGLALRHGVTVANAPATIDSDFRGHLQFCLVNLGSEPFVVHGGDRIVQAVVAPITRVRIVAAEDLGETARGAGGFGSTGRS